MTADASADRIKDLEQDYQRLRRLLDQRDAPGELRHRLRSTVALLSAVIRKSVQTPRHQVSYANHLEDRLDAIARAQALADQHGEVSLHTIVAEELVKYGVLESDRVTLSGPEVLLQTRVGQVFALAIHELTINAIEHGALGLPNGRVEVHWRVDDAEPDMPLTLCWVEPEKLTDAWPSHAGFGTEVLTRMLSYSFKADTVITYGTDGLRCTIHVPQTDRLCRAGELG